MERVLYVASEAYPLIKTGGLADVAGSLPHALQREGTDVRLLLPAYSSVLAAVQEPETVSRLTLAGESLTLLQTTLPGTTVTTWLLHHPWFSERTGNPYQDARGEPWPDNAERFMLLCRLAVAICTGEASLDWQPDVLHANDWHTGPAVALLHLHRSRPRTVFTIHNLAYMGLFDRSTFDRLALPDHFWSDDSLGFYNQVSFIKGGLVYADWITTVSPTYAAEICRSPGGMGLEGLLDMRRANLRGILNGIDYTVWNPATDRYLPAHYDSDDLAGKVLNKAALQARCGLAVDDTRPLFAMIGRLVEQKGLELLIPVIEEILDAGAQLVVLGKGEARYENALDVLAAKHAGMLAVEFAYDEEMAHCIEAGADLFLMPSVFEPCGLNQLYSLRYGTIPVVRAVGGLADTVNDIDTDSLAGGSATGFVFGEPTPRALLATLHRALALWQDKTAWRNVQKTGMTRDFSWQVSARDYMELYRTSPEPQLQETE